MQIDEQHLNPFSKRVVQLGLAIFLLLALCFSLGGCQRVNEAKDNSDYGEVLLDSARVH